MKNERDAYRLLGLSPGATSAEVRSAFRKRLMQQHPDTAGEPSDGSSVQDLVDAYRMIAGSEPPARAEERPGRRSVHVRHVGREPDPTATTGESDCPVCRGAGVSAESVTCSDCLGSARITAIGLDRAHVRWCPSCRGRGERRVLSGCLSCGGSGVIPAERSG